jgi:MFS family permease
MVDTKIVPVRNLVLELVVFISGFVLMALEIAGGRLLSADFGATVYVWGSIIAIILSGLSVGYFAGGRLADTRPRALVLVYILVLSALVIACIPLCYGLVVSAVSHLDFRVATLVTVLLLLLLPSLFLGMVSPFAIKLKAQTLQTIARTSGNLSALSTLGSVLGTFVTTFVLVLWVPLSIIFYSLAVLLVLSAILIGKGLRRQLGILALAGCILLFFHPATHVRPSSVVASGAFNLAKC